MSSAPQNPTLAALGRQLALLVFVDQELDRWERSGRLYGNSLVALRAAYRERRWVLSDALLDEAERLGRWSVVRAAARSRLRIAPDDGRMQARLGLAELRLGRGDEAFARLRQSAALGESARPFMQPLAQLYLNRGSRAEAVLALGAARGIGPRDDTLFAEVVAQERAAVVAAAPARAVGRPLRDTSERLEYLQTFLGTAGAGAQLRRDLIDVIQRDLRARLEALALPETRSAEVPLKESVAEAALVAQPAIPQAPPEPVVVPQPRAKPVPFPKPAPPREPFNWATFWSALLSERMLRTVLYLGATLLVVSAFTWVVFNWNDFSQPVQFGVLTSITGMFYGAGGWLRSRLGLARSGETLVAIGAGWVAVDGWALASLGLLQLTPAQTWLLSSALCVPAYLLTFWWIRKELFSGLTAVAAINLLLASLTVAHVAPPWQSCALLVLLIGFLLASRSLRTLPAGKALADPLVWIAQGLVPVTMFAATFLLRDGTTLDRALLATDWWLALGFYLLSLRVLGGIGFEQAVAWVAPAALVFSAEAIGLPRAWHGALLLIVTPLYLLLGQRRAEVYAATERPWRNYPLIWPAYSTAYLLSLLALAWPERTHVAAVASALGAAALYAASARIFRRPIWAWLACVAGLLACAEAVASMSSFELRELVLVAAVAGAGYWLVGVLLARAPRYGAAPLVTGYGLLTLALLGSLALEPATQLLVLPLVFGVCLASGLCFLQDSIWMRGYKQFIPIAPTTLASGFFALAAALLPCWLSLVWPGLSVGSVGLSRALLASGYLLTGWMFRKQEQRTIRRGLTGAAVVLTAIAPLSLASTAIPFLLIEHLAGWTLAQLPVWGRTATGAPSPARPRVTALDVLGLIGGAIAQLLPLLLNSERLLLLATLLTCASVYLLAVMLYRRAAGLYVAGGLLIAAWLVGLQWFAVLLPLWGAWTVPLALLFVAAGLLLERRLLLDFALPNYLYGYGSACVGLAWILAAYGLGALDASGLAQGALAITGLACLAIVSTLHFRRPYVATLAAGLPVLAYLLALDAFALPLSKYGLAFALLATVYLGLVMGHKRRWLPDLTLFRAPLLWCSHLLAGGALLIGINGDPAALAQTCALLAVSYALAAIVLRQPLCVVVASLLLPFGATLGFEVYGVEMYGLPASAQALLTLGIGWAYISLGLRLRRAPAAYLVPLHTIGFALVALAPLWAIADRPMLLASLGAMILLCVRWAWLAGHGERFWIAKSPASHLQSAFLYPVAVLAPLWTVLLVDYLAFGRAWQGLALALVAPLWLLLSRLLRQSSAAAPFRLVAYALPVLAPLLGFDAWPAIAVLALNVGLYWLTLQAARRYGAPTAGILAAPFIAVMVFANLAIFHSFPLSAYVIIDPLLPIVLLVGAAVYTLAAAIERRPFWSAPAALTVPAIVMLVSHLVDWGAGDTLISWALILCAFLGIGCSWLLDWRLAGHKQPLLSTYTLPLYAASCLSVLAALLVDSFGSFYSQPSFVHVLLVGVATLCYTLCARRFRDPLWLYAAGALVFAPQSHQLFTLLHVPSAWSGPLLVLGSATVFIAGRWLEQRNWSQFSLSNSRPAWLDPRQGMAWGIPLYLLGGGGSLVAMIVSIHQPWPFAITLLGATLLYVFAAGVWRSRLWLAAALVAGHAAYGATFQALGLSAQDERWALTLLPPMLLMALTGLLVERRVGKGAARALLAPALSFPCVERLLLPNWAQVFYFAATIDLVVALYTALPATSGTLLTVVWTCAALLGLLATLWGDGVLVLAAITLLAVGVDALLARLGWSGFALRLSVLALEGLIAWWIGQGGRWLVARRTNTGVMLRLHIWSQGLLRWGLAASGLALWFALLPLQHGLDTLPLSRVLTVVGLLIIGVALVERRLRLSYLGSGMLVGAWMLTVLNSFPPEPQLYAIPAGVYLLALGAAERWRGSPQRLAQLLELLGMSVLLGVTFSQSLPANLSYGALLGFQCLLLLVWGALQRVRLLFFGSIIVFLLDVVTQSIRPIQHVHTALLAFAVGLVLVVAAVYIERRRDQLLNRTQQFLAQLETWN